MNTTQTGTKPTNSKEIKAKRIDVIWSENRDEIFEKRLQEDRARLQAQGFDAETIEQKLSKLHYVRFHAAYPKWLYPTDTLPKGYKWTDGTKYTLKSHGQYPSETYVFLPIENDLYIKTPNSYLVGVNVKDKAFLKVKDFRMLTAIDFINGYSGTPFFLDCILHFWKDNGGRIGLITPMDRPSTPEEAEKLWNERKRFIVSTKM